jgi:hypothetical protein
MTTIIMLDELCAPVIQVLAMQYATRILDCHLGNYELEEGEIIGEEEGVGEGEGEGEEQVVLILSILLSNVEIIL